MTTRQGHQVYQRACAHDRIGEEAEAIPCYEEAIRLGLDEADLRGAFVGLGSSYRNVGRLDDAIVLLSAAIQRFPGYPPLLVFLALALHDAGRQTDAVRTLLDAVLARPEALDGYEHAVRHYRDDLRTAAPKPTSDPRPGG